jgi:methyl-accepting chemotaxis protein
VDEAKPQYVQWLAAVNKLIDYEEAHPGRQPGGAGKRPAALTVMLSPRWPRCCARAAGWIIARSVLRQLGAEPQAAG